MECGTIPAGWLNPQEVDMLGTHAGRRQARASARRSGLGKVMNEYIRDATHLAFTRNRPGVRRSGLMTAH